VPVSGKGDVLVCIRWVHNAMIFRLYHTSMVGNVYTVFPSGQSGQSGHGFEKPGSVRLKLSTAAKARGRPGNRRVERIGDPGKAARFPGKACRCPGKASVVHEPSGLEPDSSRAWLEPGGATSRAGSSLLATGLLAARTGVHEPTRL